jgi:hypothetical protein
MTVTSNEGDQEFPSPSTNNVVLSSNSSSPQPNPYSIIQNTDVNPTVKNDQTHEGDVPILSTDISRLIKERVLCGTVLTIAILDTGAAISVL